MTGTLLSLMSVGNLLAGLLMGMLPSALGMKRSVLLLTIGYAVGYGLMGLTGLPILLALAFFIVGIAKGSVLNTCTILVSGNSADRTRGMNLMHSCYACGALLCPFLIAAAARVSTELAVFLLAAIAPGVLTPYGPKELFARWLPSGGAHLLGTNAMGYDIFTELVYGARQTLLAGVLSSILALALGALIGILSTFRGWLGGAFNALIQIFILLPKLIALIVLAAFFGSSTAHLVVLIAAFSWAGTARAVRAKVLQLRTQTFIEACRIQGYSRAHIALRHLSLIHI